VVLRLALNLGLKLGLKLGLGLAVSGVVLLGPPASAVESRAPSAAYASVEIGRSVAGRPIVAWHLGETHKPKVVLIAGMHGNEAAPTAILRTLRDGKTVHGIDLWVVPAYNPDGLARGTRRNARGVDLNRNYPYHWAPLGGSYYSGPKPASEPETRAMMRFLGKVRPDYILSFHQPLHGVDVAVERPAFARRVARMLGLPTTTLDCGGVCHGTMTGWYNHRFPGFALTVEYGARPGASLMTRTAPGQVLRVFGAWRGTNLAEPLP
jgi:predicted deacylase